MTHASLFSGIGGFDLAAQWAGWTNLFNCEINPFCQTVLKHHFPNATQYSDIRATDFTVWRGQIDVLTGGFPCQPFSVAGKRKGTDDDRYLWPEMLRATREISPRFVVGENVRGIINWSKGMVFEQVCADLETLGYEVTPFLIPAVAVNAPHRRDRVWFIAHAKSNGNSGRSKEVLQENGRPIGELYTQPIERGCIRATADPDDHRSREWPDKQESISRSDGKTYNCADGEQRTIADTQCRRGREMDDEIQSRQSDGARLNSASGKWLTADPSRQQSKRMRSAKHKTCRQKQREFRRGYSANCRQFNGETYWQNFPTQSPVCRRDDGLSLWLDFNAVFAGIPRPKRARSFPRWRSEAIKGYGNAVVPQVVLQIFNAINKIYQQCHT